MRSASSHSESQVFSHPGVPLGAHLEGVGEAAKRFALEVPLNLPFPQEVLGEIAWLMGLYHDIGKATPFFQEYLHEEDPERKAFLKNQRETRHSLISAVAAYFAVREVVYQSRTSEEWREFLPIVAFVTVRRHHGDLNPLLDDVTLTDADVLQKQVKHLFTDHLAFLPCWDRVYPSLQAIPDSWPVGKFQLVRWLQDEHGVFPYFLQNFVFSLLLDADKHITALGETLPRISIAPDLIDHYRALRGFNHPTNRIDQMRHSIYQEVISTSEEVPLSSKTLSLTAPTGTGKTLTVMSVALKLRERIRAQMKYLPRIVYALPFLSIIDQNADVLRKVFKKVQGQDPTSDILLIHHHLSDLLYTTEEVEYEAEESEILVEGWDSEIVVTTFVQLFHTLFSNRNRALRKFHKLAGSIVILDEIQSFPRKYWLLFREATEALTRHFHTRFILTTATQPAILGTCTELLPRKKEYFQKLNRTALHVHSANATMLDKLGTNLLQSLKDKPKDTLVVLNTIRSAEELYIAVKDSLHDLGIETHFLSSHVVPKERLRRIQSIKNSKNPKVVISTQLIEAGVDLDFEWVIRDLGPMDAINQVAGRANRNFSTKESRVDIVLLVDEHGRRLHSYIYDGLLISLTQEVIKGQERISEPEFLQLIDEYFHRVKERLADDESHRLLKELGNLNYEQVGEFRLIEEQGEKVDIFVELDREAQGVWERFCAIQEISDRWERRMAFKALRGEFYPYVISVQVLKVLENLPPEVCGFRYIPKEQLDQWYDLETGFKVKGGKRAWMF